MKKPLILPLLLAMCLSFLVFQCEDDNNTPTQEEEYAELEALRAEIEALVNSSVCNENTECKIIGFGSKPCGGPWSYLVYSTSIDTEALENKVEAYNQLEAIFNAKWGAVSDCSLAQMPSEARCEDNKCVAVYP